MDVDERAKAQALLYYTRQLTQFKGVNPNTKMFNAPKAAETVVDKLPPFPEPLEDTYPTNLDEDEGDYLFFEKKPRLTTANPAEEEEEEEPHSSHSFE